MAIPLIWIGAVAVATLAGIKHTPRIAKHRGFVEALPGDSQTRVRPVNGAVVCCEVYNVLDHTGIWIEDSIVELNGNGLIRAITPERFIGERSGDKIFIACDENNEPLVTTGTAQRAISHIYEYRDYDLLKNNCHRFVWETVTGQKAAINYFTDLNQNLSKLHDSAISWHLLDHQSN